MGSLREAALDGRRMTERAEAAAYLRGVLPLPEWWGGNLDALYDALTDLRDFRIVLTRREAMESAGFGRRLLAVFRDAATENPGLVFIEKA